MKKIQWLRLMLYPFIALAVTVLASPIVEAKKLYKYQDQHGRWHFSDRPPTADQGLNHDVTVEVEQLSVTRRAQKVSVRRRGVISEPAFYIINEYRGPIELELLLGEGSNVTAIPELPRRFVVPGASEIRAASLRPTVSGRSWSYDIGYRLMLGDPDAKHQPARPYRVPFAVGKTYPITQGFNGKFSHTDPANRYAVDIGMPEGSAIYAARDGIVMDVVNDFTRGGTNPAKFLDQANLIRVLHDDGTMAVYGHLKVDSARVAPGVRVKAGQLIARSGNTGFSTGPHLHFVIQKNAGMKLISVPFEFAGANGTPVVPEANTLITAFPPE